MKRGLMTRYVVAFPVLSVLIILLHQIVNFSMNLLQERDNQLCDLNETRRSSKYYSSFFMDKLTKSSSQKVGVYDFSGVAR
jgi:hypothetical protein